MKVTKRQLRRIIREENVQLSELGPPPDSTAPGWHPNDSEDWERQARWEDQANDAADKAEFLSTEQARWEDHWGLDTDEEAAVVKKVLSDAYDALFNELY